MKSETTGSIAGGLSVIAIALFLFARITSVTQEVFMSLEYTVETVFLGIGLGLTVTIFTIISIPIIEFITKKEESKYGTRN